MDSKEALTAVAVTGLIVALIVVGAIVYFSLRLHATGTIKLIGLEAFADPEATLGVSSVDWGLIPPGGVSQTVLYLKSTATVPANLSLEISNWAPPEAASFMNVTWDYDGSPLLVGEVRRVILQLFVADTITGITNFSFDITMVASG